MILSTDYAVGMSESSPVPTAGSVADAAHRPAASAPFIPVIPAGGAGTRLWPLSRRHHPKFLLDLTGRGSSLLQQTLTRLEPIADRPAIVVTGTAHAAAVGEQLGDRARVLTEPSGRNSMPAIALAAAVAVEQDENAIIGSFAADHLIEDAGGFRACVERACAAAAQGYLVTIGIEPSFPATGFGYIQRSAEPAPTLEGTGALPVHRFVEKPDRERAEQFLAESGFFWNAGMFVVQARTLLDALAEQIPSLAAGACEIAAALGTAEEEQTVERVWPTLTSIAIDHALAEPLAAQGRVAVVPASFDWDDVGDFVALGRQLRGADAGEGVQHVECLDGAGDVRVLGTAQVDAVASRATVYGATQRRIALVGLDGITVVDCEDALLVMSDDHAQSLGTLVSSLSERGGEHLR